MRKCPICGSAQVHWNAEHNGETYSHKCFACGQWHETKELVNDGIHPDNLLELFRKLVK